MRKLLLLLVALAWAPAHAQPVGPPNPILCNQIATLATGGTGLTKIISNVTGTRIFICGWSINNTAAAGTWLMATGTGTNCGTGTVTLIPAQSVTSSAGTDNHVDYAHFQTAVSVDLCLNPSVSTIAGVVWFAQF